MPEHEDHSGACDYESLKSRIKKVLRRYFECDDNGDRNKEYDGTYGAQEAIDDIHEIVGGI